MYQKFEALLKERGVTVAEVARATGINQSTLTNWKQRDTNLSIKNAIKIADYFGIKIDDLVDKVTA